MKANALLFSSLLCTTLWIAGCSTHGDTRPPSSAQGNTTVSNGGDTNAVPNPPRLENSPANGTANAGAPGSLLNVQVIEQTMKLAVQGQVMNVPFSADTSSMDQVESEWGKPNQQDAAGAGIYATYGARFAALGFNKGGRIFDVRSYSPSYQKIKLSEVKRALGEPGDTRQNAGQTILLYTAGVKFQLLWVFSKSTSPDNDPNLDHVSVFCPQDTVNMMAQNVPNPTVVVDVEPGAAGSLFTFSIMNNPPGYTLSELEWIELNLIVKRLSTRYIRLHNTVRAVECYPVLKSAATVKHLDSITHPR